MQDTASFGNLPWRQVFTDPQLQALIEQGLAQNANLQNAALTVQMYEAMQSRQTGLPAGGHHRRSRMGTIALFTPTRR